MAPFLLINFEQKKKYSNYQFFSFFIVINVQTKERNPVQKLHDT